jgi:hypothetical protein
MDSNKVTMDAMNTVEPTHRVGPPHGLSIRGRYFVWPFVVGLLILLAITLSIALQFQAIMRRLDESRALWPAASSELSRRYAEFDRSVASSPSGSGSESGSGVPIAPALDRGNWSAEYTSFHSIGDRGHIGIPFPSLRSHRSIFAIREAQDRGPNKRHRAMDHLLIEAETP